jgi:hypothetical protein
MMIFHSFLYVYQRVLIRTVDDYRIFFNYNVSILTNRHIDVGIFGILWLYMVLYGLTGINHGILVAY